MRWSAGYFLEQSCWLLYNELSNLEPFELETEVAQYEFQMEQSFLFTGLLLVLTRSCGKDRSKPHINCLYMK